MFDLRKLRLLHEFALRGTIAAVAEALSYSPSTVSHQLAQLEREAGVALLVPDGRRVRLTGHGTALAAHAAQALEADEAARSTLATLGGSLAPVRLAAIQTVSQNLVPRTLALLAERAPGLRVELSELAPETSLMELSARSFDLVVAEQYPGHTRHRSPDHTHHLLGRDPLRLVVPPGEQVRELSELADRPWVMEPAGTAVRQWAVQQCRAAGFEPDVRHAAADLGTHVRLIAAGHAVGMLPDLVWGASAPAAVLLPLPGAPARELFAAVRSTPVADPGVLIVREALRDVLAARTPPAGILHP